MSAIERQVKIAQRRLWLNRWLTQWGWSLTAAMGLWLIGWLVNRLFGLYPFPVIWTLSGAAIISVVAASIWLLLTRDPALSAATALDKAAGLRERVSTGLLLKANSDDPFEAAVIQDATARVTGLTPRKFLPIKWPGSLSWSSLVLLVAALSLLLPEFDLLKRKENPSAAQAGQNSRTQAVLAKTNDTIEKIAEKNDIDLNAAQKRPKGKVQMPHSHDPDLKRRETLKKLDRLQDSLKKKIGDEKFEALKETKKRLRQLGEQSEATSELGELMSAMANNNFDEAEQAVKKLQEKLAKRQAEGKSDSEETKKMQEQLKEMAKKLKEAAKNTGDKQKEQQKQDLKNAGLTPEQAERVLEELSKKDPEQLKKMAKELAERMKQNGVTKEQMEKLLEKMQQQQKACEKSGGQCNKMGEKMGQAAQKMSCRYARDAGGFGEVGGTAQRAEQMEQAMNDPSRRCVRARTGQDQMENDAESEQSDKQSDRQKDSDSCGECDGTGFRKD
ncbi:MAG: hypothetical protein IPK83_19885, partial [Planctomycetes bacterium]|nr:hypothetical protein [Planctomycetota bacterium]